jgi:hypothetical protein
MAGASGSALTSNGTSCPKGIATSHDHWLGSQHTDLARSMLYSTLSGDPANSSTRPHSSVSTATADW